MEIDKLKRQNYALLYGFKALYNVMRETGGKDAWERFIVTAASLKDELLKLGAIEDLNSTIE